MAEIRSLFELSPAELQRKPALRRFLPCRVSIIRCGWFKWFWLGRSTGSNHTLLIGPYWTKRGARRAWDKVPTTEPDLFTGEPGPIRGDGGIQQQMTGRFTDNLKGQ